MENGELKYFVKENDTKERGKIIVSNCECGPIEKTIDNKKFLFQIVNAKRTYYLFCESKESYDQWKKNLSKEEEESSKIVLKI